MRIRRLAVATMLTGVVVIGAASSVAATAKAPKQSLTLTEYQISPALEIIAKGKSNFVAKNSGTVKHEVVVVRGTDPSALPTKPDGSVDEGQIPKRDKVGETGDVKSGKTKAKTLKLSVGSSSCSATSSIPSRTAARSATSRKACTRRSTPADRWRTVTGERGAR